MKPILATLLATALCACTSSKTLPVYSPDAGKTAPDAGTTKPDAGTTTPDSGTPDAGAPDAGGPDAGAKVTGLDESRSAVVVRPADGLTADGVQTATVTVTLIAPDGSPLAGIPVDLAAEGAATLTPASGTTDDQGAFTATVSSTVAGVKTVRALAHLDQGPTPLYQEATVTFSPGAAAAMVFSRPPLDTTAGAVIGPVAVSFVDANGNLTGLDGPPVSIALLGTGAQLIGTLTHSSTGGTAVFDDLTLTTASDGYALVASADGLAPVTSPLFNVEAAEPSTLTSTVGGGWTGATADGKSAVNTTLTVRDGYGNPCVACAVQVSVSGTANTLSSASPGLTDASGLYSFSLTSTHAEQKTISMVVRGLVFNRSANFYAGPADPAHSSLTVSTNTVVADGKANTEIDIKLADAFDNPIVNSGSYSVSGGNNLTSGPWGTDSTGVKINWLASTRAEVKTITLPLGNGQQLTQQVTFVPGPASALQFVTAPTRAYAGEPLGRVQVRITDANGNPVPDATDPVTISLASNPGNATLSGTLTQVASGGVATFDDLSLDRAGSGDQLLASSGPFTAVRGPVFDTRAFQVLGPWGGDITAVEVDPGNGTHFFVGTRGAGVFTSTDSGLTWSSTSVGLTDRRVDYFTNTGNGLFARTPSGLFRSGDAAASWVDVNSGLPAVNSVSTAPGYLATIFAATINGVFSSTNQGASWTALTLPAEPDVRAILPESTYLAGTASGELYRSGTQGSSWTDTGVSLGAPVTVIARASWYTPPIYAGTAGNGLQRSDDQGVTWTPEPALGTASIASIVFSGTYAFVTTSDQGAFETTDQGKSWHPIGLSLPTQNVRKIALGRSCYYCSPMTWVAATDRGVFVSTDSGSTWTLNVSGISNLEADAIAVDPTNPDLAYAAVKGVGVEKTTEGGQSWAVQSLGLTSGQVRALAIDPATPGTVYAATADLGLFKSTDAAASWASANSGLTRRDLSQVAVDPVTPGTLYVASATGGVFKSVDSGASWTAANSGLAALDVTALEIDPGNPSTLYAGTGDQGLFVSTDGATTWTAVAGLVSSQIASLAIGVDGALLVGTSDQGAFRSDDGGASWTALGSVTSPVRALAVDPRSSQTVFAGTGAGVLRSDDGGQSWTRLSSGLLDDTALGIVLAPSQPNTLYVATQYAGVARSGSQGR